MKTVLKLLFELLQFSAGRLKNSSDEGLRILGGSIEALSSGIPAMITAAEAAEEGESGYRAIIESVVADLVAFVVSAAVVLAGLAVIGAAASAGVVIAAAAIVSLPVGLVFSDVFDNVAETVVDTFLEITAGLLPGLFSQGKVIVGIDNPEANNVDVIEGGASNDTIDGLSGNDTLSDRGQI